MAACGAAVPQLSGRGLGHTGGTLDKLESIPGWRATLSNDEFIAQLRDVGAVICAAGDGLAPADRKLYALRDVTGTVEAIPLIASSIMSKKIAEGTGALVLDVKVGSGAFMKAVDQARELARTMVELGTAQRRDHGRPAHRHVHPARPGGRQRGRGDRVARGAGRRRAGRRGRADPGAGPGDARRGRPADADPAEALRDGAAMDSWRAMIRAQGGDPDAPLPAARETEVLRAERGRRGRGRRRVRHRGGRLAARRRPGAQGGPGQRRRRCGLLKVRPGDAVRAGDVLLELRADDAGPASPAARGDGAARRDRGSAQTRARPGTSCCHRPHSLTSHDQGRRPTPAAVREASLDELARLGLPLPPAGFPLVWEPGDTSSCARPTEIEARAAVLHVVVARCFGMPTEAAMSWLLGSHLVDLVTPPEWQFVMGAKGDHRSFVLHHDAVFALAWLLGLSRHLDPTAPPEERLMSQMPDLPAGETFGRLAVPVADVAARPGRGGRAAGPLLLPGLGVPGGRAAGCCCPARWTPTRSASGGGRWSGRWSSAGRSTTAPPLGWEEGRPST